MPASDISISPLVMFNPVNIFRGISLGKRISRNPDKATLEEVLPPELYQRFSALKTEYFPRNKKIESMRPYIVSQQIVGLVQGEAGLTSASEVGKKIRRMVRSNKDITVTEVKYELKLEGGFKSLAQRTENLMDSLSWELELSCLERQLTRMEDINEMQYRASTWAQGYIQEFRFMSLRGGADDDCTNIIATSTEQDLFEDITSSLDTMWLDAAEKALQTNQTTFAVLDFSRLLLEDGLVAQLAERGYEVIEP
jgi:hypothetical protein